jgi:hypothetical protein
MTAANDPLARVQAMVSYWDDIGLSTLSTPATARCHRRTPWKTAALDTLDTFDTNDRSRSLRDSHQRMCTGRTHGSRQAHRASYPILLVSNVSKVSKTSERRANTVT